MRQSGCRHADQLTCMHAGFRQTRRKLTKGPKARPVRAASSQQDAVQQAPSTPELVDAGLETASEPRDDEVSHID